MDRNRHVAIFLRMMAVKEIALARQSKKLFSAQGKIAAEKYKQHGQSGAEDALSKGVREWIQLLTPNYSLTVKDFSDYTFEQLGAKKSNFLIRVERFIQTQALLKSAVINKTTIELMRSAISKGSQEGLGEEEIARNIRESVGGSVSDFRSRTIARTETHNAATYAMQEAAEDTKLVLDKQWVSVHDERTRDAHVEADGQTRALDEPYEVDGELIDRPGEGSAENSINCRCTEIYIPRSFGEF